VKDIVDVALVATVLNEGDCIADFLVSIERQVSLPREFVICDGGSTDGTLEALRQWQAPAGVRYEVVERPGVGISEGRNAAIQRTTSQFIAVTDAGAEPEPAWLGTLAKVLDTGVDVASGFFVPRGRGFMETVIARVITPTLSEIEPSTFLPSSRSVAFRRAAWQAVGGYPEWLDYCEDLVFDLALRRSGAKFQFTAEAVVAWNGRPNLSALGKQYWRYARGDAKAGLFPKRHAARYFAYLTGVTGLVYARRNPMVLVALAVGASTYHARFVRRVMSANLQFGGRLWFAVVLTPCVVSVGDSAKMAGYIAGLCGRTGRRNER
jgi:glycosyltransferase involved in cell wall biosynthesis